MASANINAKIRRHILSSFNGKIEDVMDALTAYYYNKTGLKRACVKMVPDGYFDAYYGDMKNTLAKWGFNGFELPRDNERVYRTYTMLVSEELYSMAKEYIVKHPKSKFAQTFGRRY